MKYRTFDAIGDELVKGQQIRTIDGEWCEYRQTTHPYLITVEWDNEDGTVETCEFPAYMFNVNIYCETTGSHTYVSQTLVPAQVNVHQCSWDLLDN